VKETALRQTDSYFNTDTDFNELYPFSIQILSTRHWTPIHIARLAIEFLNDKENCKILDIGSGVGKFCLNGAHYAPNAHFYGIEQRENLVRHARNAQKKLGIQNVSFLQGNFTQLKLQEFDRLYFYNSFYENLDELGRIDKKIDYSEGLYEYYTGYLHSALKEMPKGTKIVTYHSFTAEIPREYQLIETFENGNLNFWMKK
jgi:SAM-dependent methyltransferase